MATFSTGKNSVEALIDYTCDFAFAAFVFCHLHFYKFPFLSELQVDFFINHFPLFISGVDLSFFLYCVFQSEWNAKIGSVTLHKVCRRVSNLICWKFTHHFSYSIYLLFCSNIPHSLYSFLILCIVSNFPSCFT